MQNENYIYGRMQNLPVGDGHWSELGKYRHAIAKPGAPLGNPKYADPGDSKSLI